MAASLAFRDLSPLFFRFKAQIKEKKLRFTKPSVCLPSPTSRAATRQQRLLSFQADDEELGVPSHRLPPRWVDALEELHDDIAHLKERMGQLQKVQQRRLLQVFGDSYGETAIGREIDTQTAHVTQLFHRCEAKLQQLGPRGPFQGSATDSLMQQNAQKAVAAQLQGLSQAFRQQQKAYLEEIRRRSQGDDLLPDAQESTAASLSMQRGLSDDMMAELEVLECDVDVRREEIAKVAQSVTELHQLFKDTATLVIEQGTLLDRIDYNLEQVAHQSSEATREIQKAEQSRRSGFAAKCIYSLSLTIFFLLVLLIIKHT